MDINSLLNSEPAQAGHVKQQLSKSPLALSHTAQATQPDATEPPRSLIVRFKHPSIVRHFDSHSTTQDTTEANHLLRFKAPTTAQDSKTQVIQQDTIVPTTPTTFEHFESPSSSTVTATPPTSGSVVLELPAPTQVKRHLKKPAIRQAPRTRILKPKGPKPKLGTKENPHPSEVKVVNGWTCFTRIKVGGQGAGEGGEREAGEHRESGNDAEAMEV